MTLDEFQQSLGLCFRQPDLLQQALTHRSFVNEHSGEPLRDNERLEFLGDAVLDFIAGEMLYERFPELPEGDLTRLRSALVRTEALAEFAGQCHIGEVLRVGKGEETTGGRVRRNNLCRAFEALIGALYLDQGIEAVRSFILPRMLDLLERVMVEALEKDARSRLQEYVQAAFNTTPTYHKVSASGPDHDKDFVVEVFVGENMLAQGTGKSKRAAAQAAASAALDLLLPPTPETNEQA
ncbi:MAG: ribonuclease III [Chloroflexi bacterium]|nr:ribonuclease III [Chloroflexota bacterium]